MEGVSPIMSDVMDPPTVLDGCKYRFLRYIPEMDQMEEESLRDFVQKFCEDNFVPLDPECDLSVPTWLEGTHYTAGRKNELHKLAEKNLGLPLGTKDKRCKGFGKRESYPTFKHARAILSRSDDAKIRFGPAFAQIEKQVFKRHEFIKHVPVRQRPDYIADIMVGGRVFYATDYTSYEAAFTKQKMMSLEMVLYKYMLANFPALYEEIERVMTGKNECVFKHFRVKVPACRMSGEMCTSLGNGFSNLMLWLYTVHMKGGHTDGVVEGDDGLFWSSVEVTSDDFRKLGFLIKIVVHASYLLASFCGLVMTSLRTSMTDPLKVLINFGWSHSPLASGGARIRKQLLRAKALSLVYEHPRCPIVTALGQHYEVLTRGVEARFETNYYERFLQEQLKIFNPETDAELKLGISEQIRAEFAAQFGIPAELQILAEAEIRKAGFGPLAGTVLESLFPAEHPAREYNRRYVTSFDERSHVVL